MGSNIIPLKPPIHSPECHGDGVVVKLLGLLPLSFCQTCNMLSPDITHQRPWDILFGVVICESALLLNPLRLFIATEVSAPQFFKVSIFKTITNKLIDCLRDQSLTPEWYADPVADFAFVLREPDVTLISNHETDTSYRMSCTF